MISQNKNCNSCEHDKIKEKFFVGFRWSVIGGITYETIKTVHNFFLLQFLTVMTYGLMGSTLALVYFSTKLADIGTTHSLPPFFHLFSKSKQNFKRLFFRSFLFPQIIFLIVVSIAITFFYQKQFGYTFYVFILPTLIILETIRSFFRYFLHFSFKSKTIVLIELSVFLVYVSSIWLSFFVLGYPFSLNLIFIPHVFDSGITVIIFGYLISKIYKQLPEKTETKIPSRVSKRLLRLRFFNYILRLSKDLFTKNFLTPFFALKFGLYHAGVFHFAGVIATSIQAIIKAAIGQSGTAFLANLKEHPESVKKNAFNLLSQKLMTVLTPIVIFLGLNYKSIIKLGQTHNNVNITISFLLLLLIIVFTEFFFFLYEQFYIIEEASQKLCLFKLIEFVLLYVLVIANGGGTPLLTLRNLIIVRLVSFTLITINAYYVWKIRPNLKTSWLYLTLCTLGALFFSFIFG